MATRVKQDAEPLPGYRLIERLGRGGYGEVWKAEAPGGLFKAIKFVFGDLEGIGDDNKAAAQELKALNRVKTIRHPFLLSIERFDIIEGQLMIVMELADRNLWDRFQECRSQGLPGVPREELLRYLDESSEALDLMNMQYQIQHLDIKPQNLFLVHNHVKVADFGLAKDLEGIRATVTGGVTPVYAAPETFEGWISRFCDQYSLAIVYQELLTGLRPFQGTNTRQLLLQHLSAAPDLSSLPMNEWEIVGRALSKNPEDRFASCGEFVRAIRDAQNRSISTSASTTPSIDPAKTLPNFKPPAIAAPAADTRNSEPPTVAHPTQPQQHRPSVLKGLPALVTPGALASSSATRSNPASAQKSGTAPVTLQRPVALDTGHLSKLGVAASERIGSGVLFPVYVVGLGRIGLQVLHRLRSQLQERFGRKTLPHWKWLFIDTDPETIQSAVANENAASLDTSETFLARMQRLTHYVKREGLPPPDTWMTGEMFYKIPRDPATRGMRCLGRLALCDHYLGIAQRIRQNLESFLSDDALLEADRQTNLGIRGNRPRVYVASSIAGGTGSGMLIDLAYVIRNEMRLLGFAKPQLTGILLTPPVDKSTPPNLAIANAHATLVELNHFSKAANRYEARFDLRQPTLADPDRPFERCVLISLPRNSSFAPTSAADRAAGLISQESLTPMGRCMDAARDRFQKIKPPKSLPLQSFGCYRISFPRQRLLETTALRLAAVTLHRWCAKSVAATQGEIETWFKDEWRRRQLDPDSLAKQIRKSLQSALRDTVDDLVEAELQSLPSDLSARAELPDVVAAVDRVFRLVGKPGKDEDGMPGSLIGLMDETVKPIARDAEIKFAKMSVHFVEHPGLRLAAAEEAIRLGTSQLQALIDQHEHQLRILGDEIVEEYRRFTPILGSLAAGGSIKMGARRGNASTELQALLRSWSRKRLEFLLSRATASIYRQMLGNSPGYLREVGFCRHKLTELATAIEKQVVAQAEVGNVQDHPIFASGCKSLEESANHIVDQIPLAEYERYEENLQQQIRRQCRALLTVCLAMNEQGPRLHQILVEQARALVDLRLGRHSSAQEFFANRSETRSIEREIRRAFEQSAPEVFDADSGPETQSFVLGVAADEYGKRLTRIVEELFSDSKLSTAVMNDEIVFYREDHDLTLADLPQAGLPGAEAAREVKNRDRIEPHSRTDVQWSAEL